jgi:N-acetylglutamate synthase-like GNAT family acetyltransferase
MAAMNPPEFVVRRATVDDLGGLKILWERARLQVLELERHLTEFQLAVTMEGDLLGAMGLRIHDKEGLLHSEAFTQPENEEQYRATIWGRVQNLARNHGLLRIWTREQAPFWGQAGFAGASAEQLKKLPPAWGDPHARWLALQLREDAAVALSLEQEFELFQEASRASTEQVMAQARKLRVFANVMAAVVFVLAAALVGVLAARHYLHSKPAPVATEPR